VVSVPPLSPSIWPEWQRAPEFECYSSRQIFAHHFARFWLHSHRSGRSTATELPFPLKRFRARVTRRSVEPIADEVFIDVVQTVREYFDLILIDQPITKILESDLLLVAENTLPSLIGLNVLREIYKPKIVLVNKFTPRVKKRAAIEGFILDEKVFRIATAADLHLTMGFGIARKSSKRNERVFEEILSELLR
jgi:hypothetical protein